MAATNMCSNFGNVKSLYRHLFLEDTCTKAKVTKEIAPANWWQTTIPGALCDTPPNWCVGC